MGRGRAKAKQTKVARELKYRHQDTDFGELARELHGDDGAPQSATELDDGDEDGDRSYRYDGSESTAS